MSKIRAISYSIGDRTYQRSVGYTLEVTVGGVHTKFTIDEITEVQHKKETMYEIWIRNEGKELALWKRIKADNIEIEYDNYDLLTL